MLQSRRKATTIIANREWICKLSCSCRCAGPHQVLRGNTVQDGKRIAWTRVACPIPSINGHRSLCSTTDRIALHQVATPSGGRMLYQGSLHLGLQMLMQSLGSMKLRVQILSLMEECP